MPVTEDEFHKYIKRAAQPLELKRKKDAQDDGDDCSDKQTHPHSSEDTSD